MPAAVPNVISALEVRAVPPEHGDCGLEGIDAGGVTIDIEVYPEQTKVVGLGVHAGSLNVALAVPAFAINAGSSGVPSPCPQSKRTVPDADGGNPPIPKEAPGKMTAARAEPGWANRVVQYV